MKLLIDNNDGLGEQDYTACVETEHLPEITRSLNEAATMTAVLASADASFKSPVNGARVILERGDGSRPFTGYLAKTPERQYVGRGQETAWRLVLKAVDDSWLLDRNPLPDRAPLVSRSAGDALKTLANDVLPGGLDDTGVDDVDVVDELQVVPQRGWSEHVRELATRTRAAYRAHDAKLYLQEVGRERFSISEDDRDFAPGGLTLAQPDLLRNDVTIVGEMEARTYVRDYFLGDGLKLNFYLSQDPYDNSVTTILQEDYLAGLAPTFWAVTDPNRAINSGGGQLQVNGGPATISFVERVELAGGLMMQHGKFVFRAASSATIGGIYNGTVADGNCVAGFKVSPSGSNSSIRALINGAQTGPTITTMAGHQYSLATQVFCSEAHRQRQTYFSSKHAAGNGRGGEQVPAAIRVVLTVHDVNPADPGTLAAPATVLYDDVLTASPGFATYAVLNAASLFAGVSFTRLQRIVNAEIRSIVPGGQFRTRLSGALADGGECNINSSAVVHFYPPYPPQPNEQIVVAYRTGGRAMARVQDRESIAQNAKGSDKGQRISVRRLKLPAASTSIDCESAAKALLDDATQPAWEGEYKIASNFLPVRDVYPGDVVEISASSHDAAFEGIVRKVEVKVTSLAEDRSYYGIRFANEAAEPLALGFEAVTLSSPLSTIYTMDAPSSSLYLDSLTAAVVTNVIASEITVDAGVAPPQGGGIEVRRSDGGWGTGDSGNLAGRFTTRTFVLPRLSRIQGYYLRQYDGSSPAKYSRYSALLHVDYPL